MPVVLGLGGFSREAKAQSAVPAQEDRIRIDVCERGGGKACRHLVGSFISWTPDRIVLRDSLGLERAIAAGPRSVLEVSRGRYSPWGRGLVYGSLGGVGLGLIATIGCYNGPAAGSEDRGLCFAWIPLLAGAGTVVGGLAGAMSTSERWLSVHQPQGLSITRAGGGVRIGVTQPFRI